MCSLWYSVSTSHVYSYSLLRQKKYVKFIPQAFQLNNRGISNIQTCHIPPTCYNLARGYLWQWLFSTSHWSRITKFSFFVFLKVFHKSTPETTAACSPLEGAVTSNPLAVSGPALWSLIYSSWNCFYSSWNCLLKSVGFIVVHRSCEDCLAINFFHNHQLTGTGCIDWHKLENLISLSSWFM